MSRKSSENLRAEFKTLAETLEEVLNDSVDKSKTDVDKLRKKAQDVLNNAKGYLGESSERIVRTTREAAQRTDDYVRENPWHGIGMGAVVGVVLGFLLSRR